MQEKTRKKYATEGLKFIVSLQCHYYSCLSFLHENVVIVVFRSTFHPERIVDGIIELPTVCTCTIHVIPATWTKFY